MQPRRGSFQKLRTNQAYLLLIIAIVAVLIASSVLVAFLATGNLGAIVRHPTTNQQLAKVQATAIARSTRGYATVPQQTPTRGPTQANPPATQQPTQPQQNSGGNPPPTAGSTPQPTSGGNLPVQLLGMPGYTYDGLTNAITVQTQPGATVQFDVTYTNAAGLEQHMQQTADNTGMAPFTWTPSSGSINYAYGTFMAYITVTARDNNGDQGQAQATVTIYPYQY